MYFSRLMLCLLLFLTAGCGSDLAPSANDQRPAVLCGVTGSQVCQNAPDFTLSDTLGSSVTLSSVVSSPTTSAVVIYFTMWCSTCTDHMTLIRDWVMPSHTNVTFFAVDYVSATAGQARQAELLNNFDGSGFIVLADTDRTVYNRYNATMATTIVIDRYGVIRMNETYKSAKLQNVLATLP